MSRLFILILLGSLTCNGQSELDYKLYSQIIDSFIPKGLKENIITNNVVVITKPDFSKNYISSFNAAINDTDEVSRLQYVDFDQEKLGLITNEKLKKAFQDLEQDIYNTPEIDASKLDTKEKVTVITQEQFLRLFRGSGKRIVSKGWSRFYRKYPHSLGVFQFSKIIYTLDYACFYTTHRQGGLAGRGEMVIMKNINDKWTIVACFNLWFA